MHSIRCLFPFRGFLPFVDPPDKTIEKPNFDKIKKGVLVDSMRMLNLSWRRKNATSKVTIEHWDGFRLM